MNNFYRQFISHITVVYVVVLSHDITGGATKEYLIFCSAIDKTFSDFFNSEKRSL
ncbi:hypothetical protein [Leptospira noguchii]|uniref:hypothetical protein n=1 Tax=Leptospira noguchii TaxID=28182 RepID=UPI000310807A|nr:hypothetical protein [Leptospira noguchii]